MREVEIVKSRRSWSDVVLSHAWRLVSRRAMFHLGEVYGLYRLICVDVLVAVAHGKCFLSSFGLHNSIHKSLVRITHTCGCACSQRRPVTMTINSPAFSLQSRTIDGRTHSDRRHRHSLFSVAVHRSPS